MAIPFPIELIAPTNGTLSGDADAATIEISIKPFRLGTEEVDAPIVLEEVSLPSLELSQLAGEELHFPKNPDDGYIDGSFYAVHAHHPVDVTRIKFGEAADGTIPTSIDCAFQFAFEGLQNDAGEEYESTATTLEVILATD
ncbi:MAG: hypothetical protein AAGB00_11140 [Planctomycetota bacterium]